MCFLLPNRCVDTAVIYPHIRGYPYRLKLKTLTQEFLKLKIQCNSKSGHDSVEDAKCAMQLALLKAANGAMFGVKNADQMRYPVLSVLDQATTNSWLFWHGCTTNKGNPTPTAFGDPSFTVSGISSSASSLMHTADVDVHTDAGCTGNKTTNATFTTSTTPQAISEHHHCNYTGGNAVTQTFSDTSELISALCGSISGNINDNTSNNTSASTYTVHVSEDKTLGPLSRRVSVSNSVIQANVALTDSSTDHIDQMEISTDEKCITTVNAAPKSAPTDSSLKESVVTEQTGSTTTEPSVRSIKIPKSKFIFGTIDYNAWSEKCEVSGEELFAKHMKNYIAQIKIACKAASGISGSDIISNMPINGGVGVTDSGNANRSTLLILTVQASHAEVVELITKKRVRSKCAMSATQWTTAEEAQLKEKRKHNVAYMCTAIL